MSSQVVDCKQKRQNSYKYYNFLLNVKLDLAVYIDILGYIG